MINRKFMTKTFALSTLALIALLSVALQIVCAKDSFFSDLQKNQDTEGLSIVWDEGNSLGVLLFSDRKLHQTRILPDAIVGRDASLTFDGEKVAFGLFEQPPDHLPTFLAVVHLDGNNLLQKFPTVQRPVTICWSPGRDRLAFWASKSDPVDGSTAVGLWTLRLDTGELSLIDAHGSAYCPAWSPDGSKLVYSVKGEVSIYDTEAKNSRQFGEGDYATWSPDGKWIAVSKGKVYWLLDSQTGAGKVLFKQKNAFTPLWFSPDSRYVAYATRVGVSLSVVEQVDLRVRRIQDGADERIQRFPWKGPIPGIQWVRSLPLVARAKSAGK
jgi:WD40 repeat protein